MILIFKEDEVFFQDGHGNVRDDLQQSVYNRAYGFYNGNGTGDGIYNGTGDGIYSGETGCGYGNTLGRGHSQEYHDG